MNRTKSPPTAPNEPAKADFAACRGDFWSLNCYDQLL